MRQVPWRHKIEELEVLYLWHLWFGCIGHVHEVIEQRARGILRCSLDGDVSGRWLELQRRCSIGRRACSCAQFLVNELSAVEQISDRIAVMSLGKVVEIADKRHLFTRP